MENIKLAIITADREYGRALGLALVDVYKNFTVTLFKSVPVHTDLESYDLILKDGFDEAFIGQNKILLVEKPSMIDRDYERKHFCLYKYNNVRQIASELLFIYSVLTGRKAIPLQNQNAKIVLFGAFSGGTGCTSAAIACSRELKRFHDKKVLYLSMEEIESTLEYMEAFPEGKSISEYLYYLFDSDQQGAFPFLESFLICDAYGVDAFLPSPGRNVLKSLSGREMQYFIRAVLDTGQYDFLVIDAGESLDKATLTCYEMADNICMIDREGSGNYRENRIMEYMVFSKGTDIADRMAKVINWCRDTECEVPEKETDLSELLRIATRLPEDPDSFTVDGRLRDICAEGPYGRSIKKLTEAVLANMIY